MDTSGKLQVVYTTISHVLSLLQSSLNTAALYELVYLVRHNTNSENREAKQAELATCMHSK